MKSLLPFFSLAGLFLLAGCQPQSETIEGQIFLLDPEGSSIPLPLVEIQIFPQKRVQEHLQRRMREWGEQKEHLADNIGEMKEGLAQILGMREDLERERQGLGERLEEERNQIERSFADQTGPLMVLFESNLELIERMDVGPRLPQGIPTQAEYEIFQQNLTRWQDKTSEQRQVWKRELIAENAQLREIILEREMERNQRVERLRQREENTDRALRRLEEQVLAMEAEVREAEEVLDQPPALERLLEGLVRPERIVHSDANGYFAVTLADLRDRAVLARVNRTVRGEPVAHTWLLWITPRQTSGERLLLSTHNSVSGQIVEEWLP